jgi:hypothetical protein
MVPHGEGISDKYESYRVLHTFGDAHLPFLWLRKKRKCALVRLTLPLFVELGLGEAPHLSTWTECPAKEKDALLGAILFT